MGSKRDLESVLSEEEGVDSIQPPKRRRGPHKVQNRQMEPQVDLTYGQRTVFSSFEASIVLSDDDLECEDEQEALEYLRAVRDQASGIPHLLVAPKAGPQLPVRRNSSSELSYDDAEPIDYSIFAEGAADIRGYYQDGAYTAAPEPETQVGDTTEDDSVCQAYYSSLAAHFSTLRQQLHQDPPDDVVAALPSTHSANVPPLGPRSPTFKIWGFRLQQTDPLPAQVAAMDKIGIFRVLRVLLSGPFLKHGNKLTERTSRWLWSLLARLPDRGEMDSVEIGNIRDLGKRAILLMASIAEIEALREQADLGEGVEDTADQLWAFEDSVCNDPEGEGNVAHKAREGVVDEPALKESAPREDEAEEGEVLDEDEEMEEGEVPDEPAAQNAEADLEAARARLLASLQGDEPTQDDAEPGVTKTNIPSTVDENRAQMNLHATINMILTVAGEFYGQRDLLPFRRPFADL